MNARLHPGPLLQEGESTSAVWPRSALGAWGRFRLSYGIIRERAAASCRFEFPGIYGFSRLVLPPEGRLLKFGNFSPARLWRSGFVLKTGKSNQIVKIFSGTSNEPLAKSICASIGSELGKCTVSAFPDGETFVKVEENVRGEDIFIIQSTSPPTNHHLMEMFIMMDAMRRASASRITAVMPFYGYARQDRKDQGRVPITAKLVADLLTAAGADRVLTLDLHAPQIQGFFDIPVDHLYAAPVMYDYLKHKMKSRTWWWSARTWVD